MAGPLHATYVWPDSLGLVVVLGVAWLGAALLLGLALAAFVRRQSRPYLLIAGAVGTLLARTAVAGLTVVGTLSIDTHHLLEHGLDVVLVAFVVAAVYYARSPSRGGDPA
jgi:hypothetical protein